MSKELPPNPNLEYDKKQAKTLLKAYRAGNAEALARIHQYHPRLQNVLEDKILLQEFKLSDAQLVIAREYGFSSWSKLKHEIETRRDGLEAAFKQFTHAIYQGDVPHVRELLKSTPALTKHINDPVLSFDSPPILIAKHKRELLDVLLEHGADINMKSEWWAGGFGILHGVKSDLAQYLIKRGAKVDVHAAAEQNMIDVLRELIEVDPTLVHAPGGDGQRPLHFARSTEVIDYLLEHGAEIDARDIDHCSTAAQWMLGEHAQLCRYLIERGTQVDIFMASALGDINLLTRLLDTEPQLVDKRIGQGDYPLVPPAPGEHIYSYSLGANQSPHQIAAKYGHDAAYQLLLEHSSSQRRFVAACERADVETVKSILQAHPEIVATLPEQDQSVLADAAWTKNLAAVQLMLDAGFKVDFSRKDGMTVLHCAAFHGFIEIVNLLLQHKPSLTARNQYGGTALDTAIHGAVHGWRKDGNYAATVEALIQAGSEISPHSFPSGNEAVDNVLSRYTK